MLLEARGLIKEFGGFTALDDVDTNVEEGELVSLVGPNGAGESTFVNTTAGRLLPTEGQVLYAGTEFVGMKPFEIVRLGAGRSFQIASILPKLTVHESVQVVSLTVEHSPFRVSLFRRRDSFDEAQPRTNDVLDTIGLDSRARIEAGSPPYGGKRRLEVAIGLTTDSDLLSMDEPITSMSLTKTQMTVNPVHGLLADWGMTIFPVEHDMDITFDVSGRVFTLHQGRLIAQGTPGEIRGNPTVRKTYLGGGEQ